MNSTDKNNIIDGRKFSKEYTDNVLRPRCDIFKEKYHSIPKLTTIIVGDDPASESSVSPQISREQEVELLKQQAGNLQSTLEQIKQRLDDLQEDRED